MLLVLFLIPLFAQAGSEGMANMPKIAPSKSYFVPNVQAGEDLQEQRGFGDQEPQVRMMNLMMVGGSGMEGMSMGASGPMKMGASSAGYAVADAKSPEESGEPSAGRKHYSVKGKATGLVKGVQPFEFSIEDVKSGKLVPGLKINAELTMTSMNMGTESPRVLEISSGQYRVKLAFAMNGHWALKLVFPNGEEEIVPLEVGTQNQ